MHKSIGEILEYAGLATSLKTSFTPEPIDEKALTSLLQAIQPSCCLTDNEKSAIVRSPTSLDIKYLIEITPCGKSPGLDGLPFELYKTLVQAHSPTIRLLGKTMDAAMLGKLPLSWKRTRMTLLFKKGDPELLANWRSLSLINKDAKLCWSTNIRQGSFVIVLYRTMVGHWQLPWLIYKETTRRRRLLEYWLTKKRLMTRYIRHTFNKCLRNSGFQPNLSTPWAIFSTRREYRYQSMAG